MKTLLQVYGLAATLLIVGVLLWMVRSTLMYLAWATIACGSIAALIGLIRFYLPIAHQRHEQKLAWESIELQQRIIAHGERHHGSITREASGTIVVSISRPDARVVDASKDESEPEPMNQEIPASVRYEDIQAYIPRDHVLVGVGEGGLVDTREKEIKGLIWIPGSSGAGKSNTTALRVEEDYARGHRFLGIDPHFFKADSLSNLVRPYQDRFIEPIAYKPEDILRMLHLFIEEVEKRKNGSSCWPLTLLYDEIGSQVSDKPEDEIEKQIIEKTKKVIRLAGQETRGFNMNVIAISQDAAGLAFLRKRALLVLGHKTVMMSERELVCNGRTDYARQMDHWPVGRTVVYGVAIQGVLIRQQPLLQPRLASSYNLPNVGSEDWGRSMEANGEAEGRMNRQTEDQLSPELLRKFLTDAGKLKNQGESVDAILKKYQLPPGGRLNQNLKALLEEQEV